MPMSSARSASNSALDGVSGQPDNPAPGGCRGTAAVSRACPAPRRARSPQVAAHARQALGEGFGQPVGDRLEHDRRIIVEQVGKLLFLALDADAGGHREHPDVVGDARGHTIDRLGRDEVGQAFVVDPLALGHLLAQVVPGEGHFAARLVGVDLDVVVMDGIGRQEGHHRIGRDPAAVDDTLEHGPAVGIHPPGRLAHHFVVQDARKRTVQVPGLEVRAPVDVAGDLGQVEVAELRAGR
jgi:hypothetical protein